jgi:hypothetical protein
VNPSAEDDDMEIDEEDEEGDDTTDYTSETSDESDEEGWLPSEEEDEEDDSIIIDDEELEEVPEVKNGVEEKNAENILITYKSTLRALMVVQAQVRELKEQITEAATSEWHSTVAGVDALLARLNLYRKLIDEEKRLNEAFVAAFHKLHEGIF